MPADEPILDETVLAGALHRAAPRVEPMGIVERVAAKRAHRRRTRRLEVVVLTVTLVVAASVAAISFNDSRGQTPRIVTAGQVPAARIISGVEPVGGHTGTARKATLVPVQPNEGYLRGPLLVVGTTVSLAAYDRDGGSFTYPPSRVIRLQGNRVESRVDLKVEVLSVAEGEGARWVVTRNPAPADGAVADTFLKRIGPDGSVVSTQLPHGSVPVGSVAAAGGGVWIPVRDGVIQFDPATTRLVGSISLSPADTRSIALVGKAAAWVTDGNEIRRLDPSTTAVVEARTVVDGAGAVRGFAGNGLEGWLLVRDGNRASVARVGPDVRVATELALPTGFSAASVNVSGSRAWVTGSVKGSPAIVLLDASVRATIVLDRGVDTTMAWIDRDTVLAVSAGRLFRIAIRS